MKSAAGSKRLEDFSGTAWAAGADRGAPCGQVLAAQGVTGQVCGKGPRGPPLTEEQKESNRQKRQVRSRGEQPFAFMTYGRGGLLARGSGLGHNPRGSALTNRVHNLAR